MSKLFKVIYNRTFKVRPPVFYALVRKPIYLSDKLLPVKKQCSAAIPPFSDPQSVINRFGHKPWFFITLKYKAAGTIGLLFDLTTFSYKIFIKNPSTLPCFGKPHCLILL